MSGPVVNKPWTGPAFIAAMLLLVASAAGLSAVVRTLGAHLTKLPIQPDSGYKQLSIPDKLVGWPDIDHGWRQVGQDRSMSVEEEEELGTKDTISRLYVELAPKDSSKPRGVQLHTAYYTGMIDTVPHVPDRCITAHGTQMDGSPKVVDVPIDMSRLTVHPEADPAKPTVYRMRNLSIGRQVALPRGIEKLQMTVTPFKDPDGRRFFAGYFFIANGGVVASANGVRLLAFRLQDDYAYYLKVQVTSNDVGSEEELGRLTGEFLNNLLPEISYRIPDWTEVEAGRYPVRPAAGGAPPAASGH